MERTLKRFTTKDMFKLSCGDAGRAFINGIIANFLLVFFIPNGEVSHTTYLIGAALALAIIKLIGVVWDAFTDPFVANLTDKYEGKGGKRRHFMKIAFVPYALTALVIFFPPVQSSSWINIIWVGFFLFAYYTFSTLYIIPHQALQAEIVTDPQERVKFYTINSLLYVLSFAVVYLIFVVQSALFKAGLSYEWSYRIPFIFFVVVGTICLLIPVLTIKEEDYVKDTKPCHTPLLQSLKTTFKYKNFRILTIAFLVMWVALNFFNTTLVYYITVLMKLENSMSTFVMGASIILGVLAYPLINKWSKKTSKVNLLITTCGIYVFTFVLIYFSPMIVNNSSNPTALGTIIAFVVAALVAVPISIGNIIPNSCFADLAQYDYIKTKENHTGMFLASKNFCLKLSTAITGAICSIMITIGDPKMENATEFGVQLTSIVAAVASVIALIIYCFYKDKDIIKTIKESEGIVDEIKPVEKKPIKKGVKVINRIFYTILQLSWGILQNVLGILVLIITFVINPKRKHSYYHGAIVTHWKFGFSMGCGMFIFFGHYDDPNRKGDCVLVHEYGHTIQSIIVGPLFMFVIAIPSMIWAFLPCFKKYRKEKDVSYFRLYCEGWANHLGEKVLHEPAPKK